MFKDSKKEDNQKPQMEQRPKRKEIKKDIQGPTKLHHKTKEWTTRPDIKLGLNSFAPRVKHLLFH